MPTTTAASIPSGNPRDFEIGLSLLGGHGTANQRSNKSLQNWAKKGHTYLRHLKGDPIERSFQQAVKTVNELSPSFNGHW